jgi:aspartyl-tRNA(Asn)/glutamyl-tRNA(Gln) amidotransferase subunit B
MKKYKPTIGLEIHTELKTKSKMFCSCLNDPLERRPNVNVCPVCLGHPGTLPVANEEAVKKVIKTGLALSSVIPEHSKFDRKNYFYPDLPKGYQISQYDEPLCQGGFLAVDGRKIKITRVHLEEDTGRLVHPEGADYSLVDFNRAGVPLMELVTEPDITSAHEARRFAEELQLILRYLGVSDAELENSSMRVEVNLSLSATKKLGTKVEIKNLNSFRAVERGIAYEIERQEKLLNAQKKIIQETRGWDAQKEVTVSQREKEEAHDYRYFPEPDLPPLSFTPADIQNIKTTIPELPQQRRERFQTEYGLTKEKIEFLVSNKEFGDYFEKAASEAKDHMKESSIKCVGGKEEMSLNDSVSNYVMTELHGSMRANKIPDLSKTKITPENLGELSAMVCRGEVSSNLAKQVFAEMFRTGGDPSNIIQEKGLTQISDEKEIETAVKEVLAQNQKAIDDYKNGKGNALQFLVGQVMQKTRGKASPEIVQRIVKKNI